jgi:hypothetical protein
VQNKRHLKYASEIFGGEEGWRHSTLLTGNCNLENRATDVIHGIVEILGREGQDVNVALYQPAV